MMPAVPTNRTGSQSTTHAITLTEPTGFCRLSDSEWPTAESPSWTRGGVAESHYRQQVHCIQTKPGAETN